MRSLPSAAASCASRSTGHPGLRSSRTCPHEMNSTRQLTRRTLAKNRWDHAVMECVERAMRRGRERNSTFSGSSTALISMKMGRWLGFLSLHSANNHAPM
jgi:hypothetical protein